MIACVGNPVYDIIETPFVESEGRILSGCSTNAALVLSQLGERTGIVGAIGDDFKEDFSVEMKKKGIEACALPSSETGGFHLIYDERGYRRLSILGIADPITSFPSGFCSSRLILFGPVLSEISLDLIDEIRNKTKARLFLDPQGFTRRISGRDVEKFCPFNMEEIVSRFHMVKPNEHEAKIMTGFNGRENPREACETLFSWGVDIAIVTAAEAGSMIYDGSEFYKIPAYETLAVDPTGAGDTYAGGFIHAYLTQKDLFYCGLFASCTASLWVEGVGPHIFLNESNVKSRVETLDKKKD